MKQAIAGVAPPALGEVTVMTVWPSMASLGLGRWLGRQYLIGEGKSAITVGRVLALLCIPFSLALFAWMVFPNPLNLSTYLRRYRLTNRRIIIEQGLRGRPEQFVDLDRFDDIEVVVLPGQQWYPAGDLVFKRGAVETFRLKGVLRPETFRQTCLKARQSYVGVKKALAG